MSKQELEIQRTLLKEISKSFIVKIKAKQEELVKEKEFYSGFVVDIDGRDESIARIEQSISVYVSEKIRFEKWSKKLKHEIEEL